MYNILTSEGQDLHIFIHATSWKLCQYHAVACMLLNGVRGEEEDIMFAYGKGQPLSNALVCRNAAVPIVNAELKYNITSPLGLKVLMTVVIILEMAETLMTVVINAKFSSFQTKLCKTASNLSRYAYDDGRHHSERRK